jgi:hypothetical protein
MRIPATSVLALAAAIAAAGCDDPSLITVEVPDGSGMPATDAAKEGGGFDLAGCEACFMAPDTPGPGCGTEWAACQAQPDCATSFMCIESSGCFGLAQTAFIMCGVGCSSSVNLTEGTPAYNAIVDLFECITMSACDKVCFAK